MKPSKTSSFLLLFLILLIAFLIWAIRRRGYLLPGRVAVAVDTKIAPRNRTISGFDKEPPRPVASLTDGKGTTISFVENELIYMTDDTTALDAFSKRWGGTEVRHLTPADSGMSGPTQHLIRINAKNAEPKQMVADLRKLSPGKWGNLIFSSEAGLGLVAIAAHEAAEGKKIGINFVMGSSTYQDKILTEGTSPTGTSPQIGEPFDRNPNNWSYFKRGPGTQNIGVGDAWRALDQVGRLSNKVTVAVIDGGFLDSDDNPDNFTINTNSIWAMDPNRKNENTCTNGATCDWHGTNVIGTLMGMPNNSFGAAGPAGPIANALAIRMSGDIFNYLGAFLIAEASNARVVNMSFNGQVPFLLSWAVLPLNEYTKMMRANNHLLVASSGNDGNSVDSEDCAPVFGWPCWERAWYVPCENDGVTCIGALKLNSDMKLESSNYGTDTVHLFGPGSVWVGPDLQYQDVHGFFATSAAAPFVAGVAALVFASNPSLSANNVEQILLETANTSSDGLVGHYVNAYAAVIKGLGGTPPDITIAVNAAQQFGQCEALFNFSATVNDPDNGPPTVKWTSDIAGPLGTGNSFSRTLPPGTHRITASATDGIGLSTESNEVVINGGGAIAGPTPTVNIISLTNHQKFAANQDITLEAGGLDPNKALGGLVAANLEWSDLNAGALGTGQRITRRLPVGSHFIIARYKGICGGTADDQRLIEVTPALVDAPPHMHITVPSKNDIVIRITDDSGSACLDVGGFGFDEEDQDFATIDFWETSRSDLQIKALAFTQNAHVCLKGVPGAAATVHQIRLRGRDSKGNLGFSSPLQVTVLPDVN